MAFSFRVRPALSFVAAAAAAVVAGCAAEPPPEAPKVPAGLEVSQRLIDMASGYRAYVNRTRSMSPAFVDGTAVATSLSAGAAYDPPQLLRGAIAYGAIVALQDRTFTNGVRAQASTPTQRQELAYAILRDPYSVTNFPGAANAASAVSAALTADGQAIYDQGSRIKQAAYDIQAQAWSKAEVAERPMRLERVKAPPPLAGDLAEGERLRLSISAAPAASTNLVLPPPTTYPSIAVRALGVAAIAALGFSDSTQPDLMTPLMVDAIGGNCLNLAKLDLYQCLSVSKPYYEDVFCLGRHAMMDTGLCLMKSTGAPLPAIEVKPIATGLSPTAQAYKAAPKWKPKTPAKPAAKPRPKS
jgi:hypothetical protein